MSQITHIAIHLFLEEYAEEVEQGALPSGPLPGLRLHDEDTAELLLRIELATGRLEGWDESGEPGRVYLKARDEGTYFLLNSNGEPVERYEGYVPHSVVPGSFGDYIDLQIEGGTCTNWPSSIDLAAFRAEFGG